MRRALVILALSAVPVASAPAATVDLGRACHRPTETVTVTGTGFVPDAPFVVLLDAASLGSGTVDGAGVAGATFPAPAAPGSFGVLVRDALGTEARATLAVARAGGRIGPPPGAARAARVRFTVEGFGAGRPVWLHWRDPAGRVRGPVRLGTAAGPCGALTSARRPLLPRGATRRGRWRVQLDTRRSWSPRATPRVVQHLRLR